MCLSVRRGLFIPSFIDSPIFRNIREKTKANKANDEQLSAKSHSVSLDANTSTKKLIGLLRFNSEIFYTKKRQKECCPKRTIKFLDSVFSEREKCSRSKIQRNDEMEKENVNATFQIGNDDGWMDGA